LRTGGVEFCYRSVDRAKAGTNVGSVGGGNLLPSSEETRALTGETGGAEKLHISKQKTTFGGNIG